MRSDSRGPGSAINWSEPEVSLTRRCGSVAYPTGLLPTIKGQGANGVDPYLVAAIIREESHTIGRLCRGWARSA